MCPSRPLIISVVCKSRRLFPKGEELGFHYCTTEWTMKSPFVCARDGGRVQGYAHLDQVARQTRV